jgi:hypothetical protein
LLYGLRLTVGIPLVSVEVEGTQSSDEENFSNPTLKTKDTAIKAKVGLRSQLRLASFLRFALRAGAQATQNTREETDANDVKSKTIEPIETKPYAGAGLRVGLSSKIALTADAVAVFREWPDMEKNEYQTTVGFTVDLP